MPKRPREAGYVTVTVTGSKTSMRADGSTALILRTLEGGSIAFRVDLRAIGVIRKDLAKIEAFLLQQGGSA